jgi:hypothetical protein
MTIRTGLLAICVLILCQVPASPKGSGGSNKHDPYDSQHIDTLPLEVREYIASICKGASAAQHDFATYSPGEKRWRINLEYLRCKGLAKYRRGNQCLDVDFVAVGSHFHLARKAYAECGF